MKIIRYQDPKGAVHFASQKPDGTTLRCTGDLYAGLHGAGEKADMAKLLAPLAPSQILCTCRNAKAAEALSYVLGYTCANDVSARDWQLKWGGGQWCRGKRSTLSFRSDRASSLPTKSPTRKRSAYAPSSTGRPCRIGAQTT